MLILLTLTAPAFGESKEGDVRLVDAGSECTSKIGCGRVEIYHDETWGTICHNYWDIDDATVVCRQLGYPAALKAYTYDDTSGKDTGQIWLDNVRCEGIEPRLVDCPFYRDWGSYYCFENHTEDAAVECRVDGELRKGVGEIGGRGIQCTTLKQVHFLYPLKYKSYWI